MRNIPVWVYALVMALVTYIIRAVPFTLFRRTIKSTFIKSLLFYLPYAVLAAMTVPAIFTDAPSMVSGIVAFVSALIFAVMGKSLLFVAIAASAGAFIVLAAVIHNSIGCLSGYWLTRLAGKWLPLDERDARTVAIEVGMQNGGMAGALATDVLKSAVAALPANVFSIWMNFSGSIIASFWSKRSPK